MLPNTSTPTTGANSSRLSLPALVRELQAMQQRATENGFVTIQDASRFSEMITAWEYYRESQPINYRQHVDSLIEGVANIVVVGGY